MKSSLFLLLILLGNTAQSAIAIQQSAVGVTVSTIARKASSPASSVRKRGSASVAGLMVTGGRSRSTEEQAEHDQHHERDGEPWRH